MRNHRVIGIVASLTTVGAAAFLLLSAKELPPSIDPKPHQAVGAVMAQEALSLLKEGGRLIAITRDTGSFPHPESDCQFKSFRKAVRKAKATITTVHALQVDPLRPLEVPAGDFFELMRTSPAGSVIVSFVGPPLLSEEQRNQLGQIRPKILAFCPGDVPTRTDLRKLFAARLLHAAVVSGKSTTQSAKPKNLRGVFDHYYRMVTAANVADLYAPAKGQR